jgi:small subunit ribosomal protein S6
MKRYETFIIVDPDVLDEDRNQFLDRLKGVISDQQGILVLVDEWGSRKLAYEIKKKSRGYYVRLDYCGTGALVDELERLFRIDDRIITDPRRNCSGRGQSSPGSQSSSGSRPEGRTGCSGCA